MLKELREIAMEKFASEAEVEAFMSGFEKEASAFGEAFKGAFAPEMLGKSIGGAAIGMGMGLIGAGLVKAISSGSNAVVTHNLRGKFDMALAQVMSSNKIVRGARPERAKDYAETIFRFAPHVASDPNLLGSILANAVLGESIDPQTIKTLVELEGRYTDNNRTQPLPSLGGKK